MFVCPKSSLIERCLSAFCQAAIVLHVLLAYHSTYMALTNICQKHGATASIQSCVAGHEKELHPWAAGW